MALAGALVVGPVGLAAPARAATFTSSVSPDPFSYSASQQLVYRLHVTTGAAPERVRVAAGPEPGFPGGGVAMTFLDMALEGAGTVIGSGRPLVVGDPACSPAPVFPFPHGGFSYSNPWLEADVPANTTTVIALPARLGQNAPWRTMDLAVEFRIGEPPATPVTVRSPNPVNSGPRGVPISIRTDPPGLHHPCLGSGIPSSGPPAVELGTDVLLSGRTDPLISGQLMTIRVERQGESASDIATVRVGGDGAFSYRWRPTVPGDHAIGAYYRSQTPAVTDDFSGTMALRVTPPPPPPARAKPTAITATRRVRCRARRCVIVVRGRVRRPRTAAAVPCTGKLRLRVTTGRRRLLASRTAVSKSCRYRARRRFRIRSKRARRVTVRVSYLGDPALAPRRGRAVRVRIRRGRRSPPAVARRAPVCGRKGGETIRATRDARVFKKRSVVYACLRRARRAFPLGRNPAPAGDDQVSDLRLHGRFVAYVSRESWAARIRVKELRRGRTVHDAGATAVGRPGYAQITDLELGRNGSVAWIVKTDPLDVPLNPNAMPVDYLPFWEVSKLDTRGRVLLDSGRDIAASLVLRDSTIYWARAGQVRSATLY